MAPGPRLVLCEETVRERSGFGPHRDLAELQSLSVPGTYQEKITHLGNSLMHLTGLKSLDLSRNSLVSLEGIQYLISLESLNLYYNCISSLAEVFRLHSLTELQEVDFRLNPVVKNESDYRLFVVHMLPKLRQLDDRPVRESERKASQLHFAPEDLPHSKESFSATLTIGRPHHSRARCTDALAKKCLVMDEDDEAVLNLIAECEWDLSNPPGSTSTSQKELEADLQRPQDSMDGEDSASSSQMPSLSSQKVLSPLPVCEKYRKRRMPGGRFQVLSDRECLNSLDRPDGPTSLEESLSRQDSSEVRVAFSHSEAIATEEQTSHGPSDARVLSPRPRSAAMPARRAALETALLGSLLDLVDRCWSGSGSLQSNETFLAQAKHILSSVPEFAAAQDSVSLGSEGISYLALENKSLQSRLAEQQQQCTTMMSEVTAELSKARKEMDTLRQHLDKSLEENSSLKSLLFSMKKEVKNADTSTALHLQITALETSVKQLSGEVVELKQHLEHYDRIQELTQMLQESHSSLVSTNEHLLQELSHARAQHREEMEQMHWSFQEFKKTTALFPTHSAHPGGHQSC
ncbi:centrosomal protein of 72 kDa isoform X2 [Perognathus longimembris pacificus]|uniref:centrosomal protein of 72 kDa isoform X2 n=1 Tax=Perognathus longimembris pacificus TaxID=214514 RepID=UPI002018955E|nr:centrosomal protein of 72 kDa isoform X2 [Perognathus longimembris pacificus]